MFRRQQGRRSAGGLGIRLLIGLVIAGAALASYFGNREHNAITNETQHISLTVDQEIALGLQAAPEMTQQHGGLHPDPAVKARVEAIGQRIVRQSAAKDTDYEFQFHTLADPETINAFALPGGQVFITQGLLSKLQTDGQVAGVLGHEVGHVVARHGAEHMAKAGLIQGLTGAVGVAAGDVTAQQMAMYVGQMVNMKYGRDDELESDKLGVRFLAESGYDPRAMIEVMKVLAQASQGGAPPEFFSTHPNPDRRVERINEAITQTFPEGLPAGLEP